MKMDLMKYYALTLTKADRDYIQSFDFHKTQRMEVKLSIVDILLLDSYASSAGITRSAFIRNLILVHGRTACEMLTPYHSS